MSLKLSEVEINQRLIRLRNLERMYAKQKQTIRRLRETVKAQAVEIRMLKEENETLKLRLEKLEAIIFGRKKEDRTNTPPPFDSSDADTSPTDPRSPDSYRRPLPPASAITLRKHVSIAECHHCSEPLGDTTEHVRYEEDIDPTASLVLPRKQVTKYTIERGYCTPCGTYSSAMDLRGQDVILGKNVRLLVCYLITVIDLTYEQIQTLLADLYQFSLTDGEIANILMTQRAAWLPQYEQLKQDIKEEPGVHMDETSWPIQENDSTAYAWVYSAVSSPKVIYHLASSRGKGNAEDFLGKDYKGVRITDCYCAYKNLPGKHQICWVHLLRDARDLAYSQSLAPPKHDYCMEWYGRLAVLHKTLKTILDEPFKKRHRVKQCAYLLGRVRRLCEPNPLDPKKLRDLKNRMIEYEHALFTCVTTKGIPSNNNRAERDLRKLVIKRKKSFGSKTEQGARALEVIFSICVTTWRMHRENFFPALRALTA